MLSLTASDFVTTVLAMDPAVTALSNGDASLIALALELAGLARFGSCNVQRWRIFNSEVKLESESSVSMILDNFWSFPSQNYSFLFFLVVVVVVTFRRRLNFGAYPMHKHTTHTEETTTCQNTSSAQTFWAHSLSRKKSTSISSSGVYIVCTYVYKHTDQSRA